MNKVFEIWFRFVSPICVLVFGALFAFHGLGWLPGERGLPPAHVQIAIAGAICVVIGLIGLIVCNTPKVRRRWRRADPAYWTDEPDADGSRGKVGDRLR